MKRILSFGPLFIMIAALLWSFDGLLRRSLFTLPPAVIVFWEHVLGALVLTPILVKKRHELSLMTRKEWIALVIVGLFSGALGTILYTAALGMVQFIQFSVVVLLQQLQPIWAITTAAIILKERPSRKFLAWAAVAIVASYFVTFRDLSVNLDTGSGTLIAAAFALLAGVLWGSSTSFSKIVLKKVSFEVATLLRFWVAPLFALMFIFGQNQQASLVSMTSQQWLTLAAITFSTGMVALLIYYYGLKRTPARVSTICELVWPASAIFIDYFYFNQSLTITQMGGVAILLIAIYHVSRENHVAIKRQ